MKILIVDDDMVKINKIEEVILNKFKIDQINRKYSYQSGIKEILSVAYDLILLDMSMPTFDITYKDNGGQLKEFAGKDIMRYMKRKKVMIPVIVITQYDILGDKATRLSDIMIELEAKYGDFYVGTIYYDVMIENWKADLLDLISKRIESGDKYEDFNS